MIRKSFWFAALLLICSAGQASGQSSTLASVPPRAAGVVAPLAAQNLPKTWVLKDWCTQLESRLKNLPRGECTNSELTANGAKSLRGVPIFTREVPPRSTEPSSDELANLITAKGRRILVIGGIHGDELTATEIIFRWMKRLDEPESRLQHWKFVPLLNPDGFLSKPASRTNARGVDLNRNFPTPNWSVQSKHYWENTTRKDPRRYPGPSPLSEPESQWLHDEFDRFKPDLIISVHAPLGVLDFDGPAPPPRRMGRLYLDLVGIFPGSLGNYSGMHRGIPVVTIELPNALALPQPMEQDLIWRDMLHWIATNSGRSAQPAKTPAQVSNDSTGTSSSQYKLGAHPVR